MTVNAGAIPANDWVQDAAQGGRIIGEACHFIRSPPPFGGRSRYALRSRGLQAARRTALTDNRQPSLQFADGSIASLNYLANGHRSHPKERLEVFAGAECWCLDNYRRLDAHGWPGFKGMRAWSQDKGQDACVKAFVDSIRSGAPSPIPLAEIVEVSRIAIETAERLAENRALLLFHTLRHLRPVQVWVRAWQRMPQPPPKRVPAPPRRGLTGHGWNRGGPNHACSIQPVFDCSMSKAASKPQMIGRHPARRGSGPTISITSATSLRRGCRTYRMARGLVARWIAENPPAIGTGWEPFPLSLRIANWIKWALGGGNLDDAAISSLATQLRWLERKIEWHILGNHLLANAKALIMGGLFFEGAEADRWLKRGSGILAAELGEQILGDGGHFELSPMYHALVLEDLFDLLNSFQAFGQSRSPLAHDIARPHRADARLAVDHAAPGRRLRLLQRHCLRHGGHQRGTRRLCAATRTLALLRR